VIAWVTRQPDGGGKAYSRGSATSGAPQTGEILVNTTTANNQEQPAVAMDGAGNFVVVWSGSGVGDGDGVFARRFDNLGNPIAALPEFRVNGAVGGTQSNPDVATETNGDFAVVWQSDETSKKEIWLQRYQANGTTIGGATLVSVLDGEDGIDPTIAMDDDGDLVVAWQSKDSDGNGIFARRYNNTGIAQDATPAAVNATTSKDQQRPDVAMDADGDYVVVWDGEVASDPKGVYARRFSAAGTPQGTDFRVNTQASPDQDTAAVSMSGDGRFVTWDSKGQDDGGSQGIYRQEYTAAGALDGGELLVNTTTNNDQTLSAVAMDDNGDYIVAGRGTRYEGRVLRRFAVAATATISGRSTTTSAAKPCRCAGARRDDYPFRDLGGDRHLDTIQASTVTSNGATFTGLGNGITIGRLEDARGTSVRASRPTAARTRHWGRTSLPPTASTRRASVPARAPRTAPAHWPYHFRHVKVTLAGAGSGAGGVDFGS
jgi:hypothetical protein